MGAGRNDQETGRRGRSEGPPTLINGRVEFSNLLSLKSLDKRPDQQTTYCGPGSWISSRRRDAIVTPEACTAHRTLLYTWADSAELPAVARTGKPCKVRRLAPPTGPPTWAPPRAIPGP
jgi:hypothetical protein